MNNLYIERFNNPENKFQFKVDYDEMCTAVISGNRCKHCLSVEKETKRINSDPEQETAS